MGYLSLPPTSSLLVRTQPSKRSLRAKYKQAVEQATAAFEAVREPENTSN